MKQEEIGDIARAYALEKFLPGVDAAELTDDTPLISGGVLNSLATASLVAFLEERFGIRIEAHEMGADAMDTVPAKRGDFRTLQTNPAERIICSSRVERQAHWSWGTILRGSISARRVPCRQR